jgi:hypothetical protein
MFSIFGITPGQTFDDAIIQEIGAEQRRAWGLGRSIAPRYTVLEEQISPCSAYYVETTNHRHRPQVHIIHSLKP